MGQIVGQKDIKKLLWQQERRELLKRPAFDDIRHCRRNKKRVYKLCPLINEDKGKRIQRRLTLHLTPIEVLELQQMVRGKLLTLTQVGETVVLRIDRYFREWSNRISDAPGMYDDYDTDNLPNSTMDTMRSQHNYENEYLNFHVVMASFTEKGWDFEKIKHFIYMGYFDDPNSTYCCLTGRTPKVSKNRKTTFCYCGFNPYNWRPMRTLTDFDVCAKIERIRASSPYNNEGRGKDFLCS